MTADSHRSRAKFDASPAEPSDWVVDPGLALAEVHRAASRGLHRRLDPCDPAEADPPGASADRTLETTERSPARPGRFAVLGARCFNPWHVLAERSGQIDLVFLLVPQNLPDLFRHGVFTEALALANTHAIVPHRLVFVVQIEAQHLFRVVR